MAEKARRQARIYEELLELQQQRDPPPLSSGRKKVFLHDEFDEWFFDSIIGSESQHASRSLLWQDKKDPRRSSSSAQNAAF